VDITPAQLQSQVGAALAQWPFIVGVEQKYGLPPWFLFAVGSRETNLTNEVGDYGHGHGVWQLDDRSHVIPAGFDTDVSLQATTAALMLQGLLGQYGGNVDQAACAYNSGQPLDQYTTGGNYGSDVASRLAWCTANIPYPGVTPSAPSQEVEMYMTDPESKKVICTDADGNMYAEPGSIPVVVTLGQHPQWQAGSAESGGTNPVVGITPWGDQNGEWGFCFITKPSSGSGSFGPYDLYHINRNGTPA